jgi:hypothetical protein
VKDDTRVVRPQGSRRTPTTSIKQPPKRRPLLSVTATARLKERLRQRLLPLVERPKSVRSLLDRFASGELDDICERRKKEREIEWEIDRCLPPFPEERPAEPGIPDQLWEWQQEYNDTFPNDAISLHEALIGLVASDWELEPETRHYISWELDHPPLPYRPNPERKHREFAICVKRCKGLLRKAGLLPLKAEQEIADALGISVDALRKRCQRAPKKP